MAEALAAKVAQTTKRLGITQEELARITGTSLRSVARYLSGQAVPQPLTKQRLLELAYVADQLGEVLKPEDANLWIHSPNRLLDHATPAERINAGDFRTVLALIEALADGIAV